MSFQVCATCSGSFPEYISSIEASIIMKHGHSRKDKLKLNLQQPSDGDSSLSSLGSLPEATSVTKHFIDELPSQRRLTTHLAASTASVQASSSVVPLRRDSSALPTRPPSVRSSRTCPHCQRPFTNAWAIPKHVSVSFTGACNWDEKVPFIWFFLFTNCFYRFQCLVIFLYDRGFMTEAVNFIVPSVLLRRGQKNASMPMTEQLIVPVHTAEKYFCF